jgi:hypothetical protein
MHVGSNDILRQTRFGACLSVSNETPHNQCSHCASGQPVTAQAPMLRDRARKHPAERPRRPGSKIFNW